MKLQRLAFPERYAAAGIGKMVMILPDWQTDSIHTGHQALKLALNNRLSVAVCSIARI